MSLSRGDQPNFYELRSIDLWGDYGSILIEGYVSLPSRDGERLIIKRTGPFAPPIAVLGGGYLVVTNEFRERLASRFPGTRFTEVVKEKVVEFHWETWDRNQHPEVLPSGGEPESYIEEAPHSAEAAAEMGRLWEVIIPESATGKVIKGTTFYKNDFAVTLKSWNGADLFIVQIHHVQHFVVTDVGKDWFQSEVGDWISFRPWQISTE